MVPTPTGPKRRKVVAVDPRYFRPTEVDTLLGNPSRSMQRLGWCPRVTFEQMVSEMVLEDLKRAERDLLSRSHGYTIQAYHE
jgi:GDPmannose 4,6-dehydratase